jgi:hypothetical protein
MSKFFFILFLCSFVCILEAGSIRLTNDSPYKLRVVIRGADGTQLSEMVINPAHSAAWNDAYNHYGHLGKGDLYQERASQSQTPYTVLWYCMEGSDYSFSRNVATGATVTAQGGEGARICKPRKKETGPYPNEPEGHALHRFPPDSSEEQ